LLAAVLCAVCYLRQGFSLAVKLGLTKQQVDSLVGIHPTAAEEVVGLKGPERTV
jgi:glutathione reductase (NADPH)